jgi:hypothetical protein
MPEVLNREIFFWIFFIANSDRVSPFSFSIRASTHLLGNHSWILNRTRETFILSVVGTYVELMKRNRYAVQLFKGRFYRNLHSLCGRQSKFVAEKICSLNRYWAVVEDDRSRENENRLRYLTASNLHFNKEKYNRRLMCPIRRKSNESVVIYCLTHSRTWASAKFFVSYIRHCWFLKLTLENAHLQYTSFAVADVQKARFV